MGDQTGTAILLRQKAGALLYDLKGVCIFVTYGQYG